LASTVLIGDRVRSYVFPIIDAGVEDQGSEGSAGFVSSLVEGVDQV
jgi:hypothetical protein